ncbi:NUDIX hydrolase [Kordia zhangzhouensis]|uniref:NUDIX hydrolase n=1 Tax=Kordia zhangzhouensis TaxID=1620405 RepID=UPI00138E2FFB|nr:NUDIX hydrolase [Kordia zhangzhouensis]
MKVKIIHKTRLLAVNGEQLLVIEKVGETKKLTFPGGVKKRKESFEESLKRETLEEIGLMVNKHKLSHVISSARILHATTVLKHHFALTIDTNVFKVLEPEKFKDVYWTHWKDAIAFLDKEDKKAVKKFFKSKLKKKRKLYRDESSIPPRIAM